MAPSNSRSPASLPLCDPPTQTGLIDLYVAVLRAGEPDACHSPLHTVRWSPVDSKLNGAHTDRGRGCSLDRRQATGTGTDRRRARPTFVQSSVRRDACCRHPSPLNRGLRSFFGEGDLRRSCFVTDHERAGLSIL